MPSLTDQRMLITGGSAGIGFEIARAALEQGARVVLNGRDAARLEAAADKLHVPFVAGDVGTDAPAIMASAVEQLGGLDVLVNNAGWGRRMTLEELDADVMHEIWRTNVLGAALMAQAALPHFEVAGAGALVNIASTAALKGYAGGSAYSSSKFALASLSQCWAAELRPRNIRVLQVNPSEVQTGFGGRDLSAGMNPRKLFAEDVAHAVLGALTMHPRGFVPELTIHATNPWE
ncbi:MAG: putative oxidoreductase YoxD [Planctomycetota bacterium]|nr:MAG: putative oxidoreductase YoxD [Planctomycetota bacterium]